MGNISFYFLNLILEKWFLHISLEIISKNEVPNENIHAGTLFLTVISRGTFVNNTF
jgi:hypothetical protein